MSAPRVSLVAGRYRLVRPLGEGGMGRVWLAHDEVLRREVAIKEVVPPPWLTESERGQASARSLREARAIARLTHPNVVRIYDVVTKEQWPWIVMEYVPSRSLHQVIEEDGPRPAADVARMGLAILGALASAHRSGILHRDVKPANVLLAEGRVVLTDFGLATVEGEATVTRSGMIIGSPAYISPERARGATAGPASDLWSLGATLYAAVEGRAPFAHTNAIATLTALVTEEPPEPLRAGPLRPALQGLLRKDPATRVDAPEAERLLRRAAGRGAPRLPLRPWRAPRPRATPAAPETGTASGRASAPPPANPPGTWPPMPPVPAPDASPTPAQMGPSYAVGHAAVPGQAPPAPPRPETAADPSTPPVTPETGAAAGAAAPEVGAAVDPWAPPVMGAAAGSSQQDVAPPETGAIADRWPPSDAAPPREGAVADLPAPTLPDIAPGETAVPGEPAALTGRSEPAPAEAGTAASGRATVDSARAGSATDSAAADAAGTGTSEAERFGAEAPAAEALAAEAPGAGTSTMDDPSADASTADASTADASTADVSTADASAAGTSTPDASTTGGSTPGALSSEDSSTSSAAATDHENAVARPAAEAVASADDRAAGGVTAGGVTAGGVPTRGASTASAGTGHADADAAPAATASEATAQEATAAEAGVPEGAAAERPAAEQNAAEPGASTAEASASETATGAGVGDSLGASAADDTGRSGETDARDTGETEPYGAAAAGSIAAVSALQPTTQGTEDATAAPDLTPPAAEAEYSPATAILDAGALDAAAETRGAPPARSEVDGGRYPWPATVPGRGEPGTAGGRQVPMPSRRVLVAIGVVVLVLLVTVTAIALSGGGHKSPSAGTGAPSHTPGTSAPAPSTAGTTSAPASPTQAAAPGSALPAGWHYYHDGTGFTVAVPDGWAMSRQGTIVYFREPNGARLIGIDQTDQPKSDPVADWQSQSQYRVGHGDFPGYQQIGINLVPYHVKSADWEFTYLKNGVRTHVIDRGAVFGPHQAYGFYWSTPDSQWQSSLDMFTLITTTFQGNTS